jgi:predicted DNA-binding transcriptional regulator AlpA
VIKRTISVDAERLRALVESAVETAIKKARPPKRLIPGEEVRKRLGGISKVKQWALIRDGYLKPGRALGGHSSRHGVYWTEPEIEEVIENCPKKIPGSFGKVSS